MGGIGKEALVVCSDKSLGIGITVWDIESGENLLHIPTSASPPHRLICLANQCLVASQIHRQGSVAGGVIFIWPFNKSWVVLERFGAGWLSLGTKSSCPDFGLFARAGVWTLERGIHPSSMSCVVLAARSGDWTLEREVVSDARAGSWALERGPVCKNFWECTFAARAGVWPLERDSVSGARAGVSTLERGDWYINPRPDFLVQFSSPF
ncbi:hypothetical protein HYC85_029137 [Camellia sinensis]|uniref:Uncharacterized protein n=1 Tax=Camellia sinensis TaxID=4442 RepID=A0A7J7G164_CAMSI|nr:hypothetical protein HYC85_029137 [Camellia sinensis]